ncbi:MAG: hypothetical protein KDA77_04935, partial [Planctomycetaceae bacterium]|nr:hypothetical protein [Planctomycetaceae bacterium]
MQRFGCRPYFALFAQYAELAQRDEKFTILLTLKFEEIRIEIRWRGADSRYFNFHFSGTSLMIRSR